MKLHTQCNQCNLSPITWVQTPLPWCQWPKGWLASLFVKHPKIGRLPLSHGPLFRVYISLDFSCVKLRYSPQKLDQDRTIPAGLSSLSDRFSRGYAFCDTSLGSGQLWIFWAIRIWSLKGNCKHFWVMTFHTSSREKQPGLTFHEILVV